MNKPSLAHAYRTQKETQHRRKMWLGGEVGDSPGQDEHDNLTRKPKLNEGVIHIPNDTIKDIDVEDFDEGPSVPPLSQTQHFAEGGMVGDDEDEGDELPTHHLGGLDEEMRDEEEENRRSGNPFDPSARFAKGGLVGALRKRNRGY